MIQMTNQQFGDENITTLAKIVAMREGGGEQVIAWKRLTNALIARARILLLEVPAESLSNCHMYRIEKAYDMPTEKLPIRNSTITYCLFFEGN